MITDEQLRRLAHKLEGTCQSLEVVLERMGIDVDGDIEEIEDALCGAGVEMCSGCGWWFNSNELVNETHGESNCCDGCADEDAMDSDDESEEDCDD